MNLWVDSSAWLRVYLPTSPNRQGGADCERLVNTADELGIVSTTRVEFTASMTKLGRGTPQGETDPVTAASAIVDFEGRLPEFDIIPVSDQLITEASDLGKKHYLKGFDAVQLAGACQWRVILGQQVTLATFDDELADAAVAEGFSVWPSAADRSKYKQLQKQALAALQKAATYPPPPPASSRRSGTT